MKGAMVKNSIKPKLSRNGKRTIFIVLMLAYPVLHFLLLWLFVNINTFVMSFQRVGADINDPETFGKTIFAGFLQYKAVIGNILHNESTQRMLRNSLLYLPITLFELCLSIVFSYFLYKKMPLTNVFRVIYFLPSIIPIVVLTFVFSFVFDSSYGLINPLLHAIGVTSVPNWFGVYPLNQIMIFVYCIWAGLGYNIILLSGSISRIPESVIEYGKLEGIGYMRELFQVVIPLIWPTISTIVVLACTSVFTVMLQPLMLTPGDSSTNTIALSIYNGVLAGEAKYPYLSAFGLCISAIGIPVIMIIRKLVEKPFSDVEF